jgi:uncharacterized protein YkwD
MHALEKIRWSVATWRKREKRYTEPVRDRRIASLLLLAFAAACGDGVGHPIVSDDVGQSGMTGFAGSGGAGAAAGLAGTATAAGAGGVAAFGGNFGQAGAAGGKAGRGAGGLEGFAGTDFGPPWDEEFGGRGGPDWDDEDPLEAIPQGAHCESVVEWDSESAEAERGLFRFLNSARASALPCANQATGPLPPLELRPELRCAARLHSRDMSEREFFDHVNPDGVGPEDRMRRAGASFAVASETIARDAEMGEFQNRYQAIAELFDAGGSDCNNLADARFDAVGIGVFQGLWTLDFMGP